MAHANEKTSNIKYSKKFKRTKMLSTTDNENNLEEERLEKLVFGHGSKLFASLPSDPSEMSSQEPTAAERPRLPAWTDPEAGEFVKKSRAADFDNIMGKPKWAELNRKRVNSSSDEDDDSEILRHCGNMISTDKHHTLPSGLLQFKKNRNVNDDTHSEGPIIRAVEFHQTSAVALVAGLSGIATLFQVDGRCNSKLQSIQFKQFPIDCAKISVSGTEFLVGSKHHNHFFAYDMESGESIRVRPHKAITNFKNFALSNDGRLMAVIGRFGEIFLLTARSKELIETLKANCEVNAISFNNSGSQLYAHGDHGEVYIWDTQTRACISRFSDDGCLSGTSLAIGNRYLATGSTAGAVNIYSTEMAANRHPLKTLLHIRTPVSCLAFNSSEEILAMASDDADDAARLVHLPSFTVFSNFPGKLGLVGRSIRMAFSPNSGYLAVGNNKSTVMLFRLKHYGNY